ncbi:MAG: acyl-CoA dehydrogenase family protein, partial [Pseudomonadota bacterium]
PVLVDVLQTCGAKDVLPVLLQHGNDLGCAETYHHADLANRFPPELHTHDQYGHRRDEVTFHPSYHHLMDLGVAAGQAAIAWEDAHKGYGHVAHAALEYLTHQVEAGVCCPLSMTYAAVPALAHNHRLTEDWTPRLLSRAYDARFRPVTEKTGATMGMAMTEKQGGSDVRANTTRAEHVPGSPDQVRLWGHKWFCSAPMCDAFLTLAYEDAGLSCFFVPRWTDEGRVNDIRIQRLKSKLGNRANASSEIEYWGAEATRVGDPGAGVKTIIEMVHCTRLSCTMGAASLMRAAFAEATHHVSHRSAFQKRLIDQPLMRNVIADLALESIAATHLAFFIAHQFDLSEQDQGNRPLARLLVAMGKYWLNKRVSNFVYEALECHGGAGYVEEGRMPRLYREAPLNSIWEGSGNVICLDIFRTIEKEPAALDALFSILDRSAGTCDGYDRLCDRIRARLLGRTLPIGEARRKVKSLAIALQTHLLAVHEGPEIAQLFVDARMGEGGTDVYGMLPETTPFEAIIARAYPAYSA